MCKFQILSLDGGGIKGLFSAAVLAAIEDDLNIKITDHFDLITGTSTGGIIAVALGLGMSPSQIVEFYVEDGPSIFKNPLGLRNSQHYVYRKFNNAGLISALKKRFTGKKFGDSNTRLVIPAFNLDENDVYIFRTPHHKRLRRDWKVPAWKVAVATASAPTYFPAFTGIENVRLVDGGIWANNPIMVGLVEATGTLGIKIENISALTIGTTLEAKSRQKNLTCGGLFQWRNAGIDCALDGQSIGATNQARFLIGEDRFARLDPVTPQGFFHLDKLSSRELIAKAHHHSRKFVPEFEEKFVGHTKRCYVPIYPEKEEALNHEYAP